MVIYSILRVIKGGISILIVLSGDYANDSAISFEGKVDTTTVIHNQNIVRTLSGGAYGFNNGRYMNIKVSVIYIDRKFINELENLLLTNLVNIFVENGENYYRCLFVNNEINYIEENEKYVSCELNFQTNVVTIKK